MSRSRDPEPTDEESVAPLSRPVPRSVGILLAIAAAGCLLAACFSHRWLANKHLGDLGFSPLSFQVCAEGVACRTTSNFQVVAATQESPFSEARDSRVFPIAGVVTFAVLLIAAGALLISAALAATHRKPDLPVSPTTFAVVGLLIGLVTGCIFVATRPGGLGSFGVAWSFWAFGVGSVAGFTGAQQLAKQIRPPDPDLLHDAMYDDPF